MATLWADNFYDTAAGANVLSMGYLGYGAAPSLVTTTGPRATAYSVNLDRNYSFTVPLSTAATTVFVSFALRITSGSPSSTAFFGGFRDSADSAVASMSVTTAGEWQISSGASTAVSSGAGVTSGTWKWWTMKVVMADGTGGSIELKDSTGTTIASLTGIDTKPGVPAVPATFIFNPSAGAWGSIVNRLTDLHIWDNTGSICNDWTGETQIDTLYPNAAGDSTQWTPSAGANFECVDEAQATTADFVSTSGSNTGFKDLYNMTNLSVSPVSVFSVIATAYAEKLNAGAGNIKLLCKSGATTSTGSTKALPSGSQSRVVQVFEADPATSTAWTQTTINAAQIGIEVA